MEFKGTKGKWEVLKGTSLIGVKIGHKTFGIDNINEEAKANALLISKAPEMLEMLKKLKDAMLELMEHQDGWEEDYEELEKLIKESTEL